MADHKITLTYLNIRQSIAILLAKLVLTDLILAIIVIGFYFVIVQGGDLTQFAARNTVVFLTVFGVIGIIKILISIYVVLLWLNEYYEITPEHIIHKKGVFFRTSETYSINKLRLMEVKDSFLGELFNFATITLYEIRLQKYLDLYLIHNPQRYAHVLKSLRPELELKTDHIHLPLLPPEEDDEEKNQYNINVTK